MPRRLPRFRPSDWLLTALSLALVAATMFVGWKLVRADVEARIYQDRLATLASDYRELAERYNDAVRRSAVTELVVDRGTVWALLRTAEGAVAVIETPYSPDGEIFVDYVVRDGRLWARRLYDQDTPPAQGFVLDDAFTGWTFPNDETTSVGKTVYRPLSDGIWLVRVTGNGSLSLERTADLPDGGIDTIRQQAEQNAELVRAPAVRDFDEWLQQPPDPERPIGTRDIWRALFGG